MSTSTNGNNYGPPTDTGPVESSPRFGKEQGSILDYVHGDLVFSSLPGAPASMGPVYDWREPTVNQLLEMLQRDGKSKSLEQVISMPLIGAGWHVEPGEGNDDHETAQWVETILRRDTADGGMQTSMEDVIAQMTSAFANRRSYHEKVWKQDDDQQVVYNKIAWRPPDTCTLLRNVKTGDLEGFAQWVWGKRQQVIVKLPYAHVYVHGQRSDPVKGVSELQVTYHNYRIKEKIKLLWYTYLEVMSLPRTVVLANSDDAAKKSAQAIAALKNAGVVGLPKDWVSSIQPLPMSTAGSSEFQQAIAYLDADSALSLLAGFTDLPGRAMGTGVGMQSGTRGSYGMSSSQQEFFMNLEEAFSTELSTSVTNNIVADLVRYNKGTKVQVPRFALGPLQEKDVSQSFALLQALAVAPKMNLPSEFVRELTLVVADQLGLNTDQVNDSFDSPEFKTQQEQLANAANVGANVAGAAQQQLGGGSGFGPNAGNNPSSATTTGAEGF
jgi:hypothetical protein